ncbi:MAG: type IV toxin-antitoxin system AbiEi family antitoxin domain-containing protein [Acidobacteria bacterium]|nr:type IV toxin-antitoxin system AbiEi family antitoxin domain-containing protein [Acidobacteriota bacterium]
MTGSKTPQPSSDSARLLALAQTRPVLRARDVAAEGIHTGTLARLVRAGTLEKIGAGRYRLTTSDVTEGHCLVLACSSVPSGVVCLSTALRFHNLGTQLPREVWLAVPRGTRVPSFAYPPIRVTRIAPALFDLGVEEHPVEGGVVRVYNVVRTVVDCFRFRNKVGMDVVLEALVEARRSRCLNLNELHRIAKALRVDRVMRPYLEMLVV